MTSKRFKVDTKEGIVIAAAATWTTKHLISHTILKSKFIFLNRKFFERYKIVEEKWLLHKKYDIEMKNDFLTGTSSVR